MQKDVLTHADIAGVEPAAVRTLAGEGASHVPTDTINTGARLTLVNVWNTERWSDTETVWTKQTRKGKDFKYYYI